MTKKPKSAPKPTPDPVDVSDRAQLLAKQMERGREQEAYAAKQTATEQRIANPWWSARDGSPVPALGESCYLAVDDTTGLVLGMSRWSFVGALKDVQSGPHSFRDTGSLSWAENAQPGAVYLGIRLLVVDV